MINRFSHLIHPGCTLSSPRLRLVILNKVSLFYVGCFLIPGTHFLHSSATFIPNIFFMVVCVHGAGFVCGDALLKFTFFWLYQYFIITLEAVLAILFFQPAFFLFVSIFIRSTTRESFSLWNMHAYLCKDTTANSTNHISSCKYWMTKERQSQQKKNARASMLAIFHWTFISVMLVLWILQRSI